MAGGWQDAEQRDFFLSYTGADVAWAEWAAHVLEAAGCWATQWDRALPRPRRINLTS